MDPDDDEDDIEMNDLNKDELLTGEDTNTTLIEVKIDDKKKKKGKNTVTR